MNFYQPAQTPNDGNGYEFLVGSESTKAPVPPAGDNGYGFLVVSPRPGPTAPPAGDNGYGFLVTRRLK